MGRFFNSIVAPMKRLPKRGGMQGKTLEKARLEFNAVIRSQKEHEEGALLTDGAEQPEPVVAVSADKKPGKKRARRTNKKRVGKTRSNKGK